MYLTGLLSVVLTKGIPGRREELSLVLGIREEGQMPSRRPHAWQEAIEHKAENRAMIIV